MDTQQTPENSNNNIPEQNIQALEINAQMVNRLAAIEQQKVSLESQRLELAKQQDLNGYNYSLKALELKRDSHKNEQELTEKFLNKMFWFASIWPIPESVRNVLLLLLLADYTNRSVLPAQLLFCLSLRMSCPFLSLQLHYFGAFFG